MKKKEIELMKQKTREFDEKHIISDIILLGFDGAIRRIKFKIDIDNPIPFDLLEKKMIKGHDDFLNYYCIKINEYKKIKEL